MPFKKSSTPWSSSTCHLHLHLPLLAKLWKGMNCVCSWYPGLEAIIICSLYVFMVTTDEESSLSFQILELYSGETTCMTDEYTFKRLPISLQCIPPLNMSISRFQYIPFRNSGIVNTDILELSLCTSMGVRHTVWPINYGLVNKGANNKLIPLFCFC